MTKMAIMPHKFDKKVKESHILDVAFSYEKCVNVFFKYIIKKGLH